MPRYWALGVLPLGCIISAVDLCEPPNRWVLKGRCANILGNFANELYDCCGDAYSVSSLNAFQNGKSSDFKQFVECEYVYVYYNKSATL